MKKKLLTRTIRVKILVKHVHDFMLAAAALILKAHCEDHKKYEKITYAVVEYEDPQDLFYLGLDFAGRTIKNNIVYQNLPTIRSSAPYG